MAGKYDRNGIRLANGNIMCCKNEIPTFLFLTETNDKIPVGSRPRAYFIRGGSKTRFILLR